MKPEAENEISIDEDVEKMVDATKELRKMRDAIDSKLRFKERVQCLPLYSLLLALGKL